MSLPGTVPNLFSTAGRTPWIPSHTGLNRTLAVAILLLVILPAARTQITSSAADYRDSLGYPMRPEKDPLFVFYQTHGVYKPGSLTATHPTAGNYDFEWSKYNPALPGFDAPFHSDLNSVSSSVSGLEDGGYRVRIRDGISIDTTMMAWVMLDNLVARTDKNEEGKVKPFNYTCEFLVISGSVTTDTFTYYDPVTHDAGTLNIGFRFRWTSDNEDLRIPNDSTVLDPNITYLPPVQDTWYILTATDDLGMTDVDSILYESIQTRAEFSLTYYDKVTGEFDSTLTRANMYENGMLSQGSLDAKLTVRFLNESENGAVFEWVFLDTLGGVKQTATTYDVDEYAEYTYERADEYYDPYLVSRSEEGCVDTFRLDEPIFVVPSTLDIPNVFTPNGDGRNDLFVFKHQSIKSCKVTIVDRTGKVVYRKKIDDIYQWEGWDGNLHDSDRKAPEGQYYYVVEAEGYDGEEYSDPTIFENWRLNRKNNNNQSGTSGNQPGEPEEGSVERFTGWLYLYRHTGIF